MCSLMALGSRIECHASKNSDTYTIYNKVLKTTQLAKFGYSEILNHTFLARFVLFGLAMDILAQLRLAKI